MGKHDEGSWLGGLTFVFVGYVLWFGDGWQFTAFSILFILMGLSALPPVARRTKDV